MVRSAIYLFFYGLQHAHELRIENGALSDRGSQSTSLAQNFAHILQMGPESGIHTLAWCDTLSNSKRVLKQSTFYEFGIRVAFQMSREDSRQFVDSTEANLPGLHRALLFQEETGHREKFVPYYAPSREWLQTTAQSLCEKFASFQTSVPLL